VDKVAEDTEYKICGGKIKMKKTSVSIMYEDEKLNAVKMYMEQRDLDFKEELEKSVDTLYAKYVPANVREFIDMKGSQVKTPKPKKPKPQEENTEVVT
jgi:hypothetical protein